jgi:ABC-type Co2+ transport system permease subunit
VRLICLVIGVIVAVSLPFVTFKGGNLTRREQRRRQTIVAALAAVAFVVYAATMPSFFLSATILTIAFSQWAAVLAILVALFLPQVARRLGVRK